jgi:membrane protease YdiL (CAAX protease family)
VDFREGVARLDPRLVSESESPKATEDRGKPWGLWPTLGFGLLIFVVWMIAQAATILAIKGPGGKPSFEGWVFARATIVGAPIGVGASMLLARFRKGISVAAYLGLESFSRKEALQWSSISLGLVIVATLGRLVVPDLTTPLYLTAGPLPVFFFAVMVAAPLAEEFIFRGFFLPGLIHSRLGPVGAIVATSLAFAALHTQYDLYGMAVIAAIGMVLGFARWRTGSLWLCVSLHCLLNTIASIEILFILYAP